jgi:hypothetical protein
MRKVTGYAGFCNNELHITKEEGSEYKIFAIFPRKGTAELAYEDVRKITITQLKGERK